MVTTTLMGVGLLCYIVDGFLRTYTAYSIMPRPSFVWMHKWNMAMSSLQEKIAILDLNTNAARRHMCKESYRSQACQADRKELRPHFFMLSRRHGRGRAKAVRSASKSPATGPGNSPIRPRTRKSPATGPGNSQLPIHEKIGRKDHSYDVAAIRRNPSPDGCRMIRSSRVGRGRPGRPYTSGQP